jgi:glycosyltransferase involved in cell wall biosynthesis
MLRVGVVSSFMPPHLGGLEVAAKAIFDTYRIAGLETQWIASRVPEHLPTDIEGKIRVQCWNGLERWFGVPWPVWGAAGIKRLACLVQWADVIHVHDCLYLSSLLAALLSQRQKKPVILSQHIGFVSYSSFFLNQLERVAYSTVGRIVLRKASHIAFCTPAAEEFIRDLLGRISSPTSFIPYGIDTERFKPVPAHRITARKTFKLPERSPIVLFAGRLVEKKGVPILLQVIRDLQGYHFMVVGNGPLQPKLSENLTWIPFVPPEQMPAVYQAADVFFLPSHSEGFPLAILEAMASGLPVVTSKGQTFGDILESAGAGALCERHPDAFCQVLVKILETPQISNSMTICARNLVERDYNIAGNGARYLELVKKFAMKN